jgi:hypothetical protein
MNPALVFSVISLALCIILFLYFRWYIKRRSAATELLAEYRTEVERLIADIDFVTERDVLIIEDKIKTLKELLDDTDRRIAVYVKELEKSRSGEALYAKLGQEIRSGTAAHTPDRAAAPETAPPAVGVPESTAPETVSPRTRREGRPKKSSVTTKDIKIQIAELALQGYDPARIASKLKISVSEVELALNFLRR